MNKKAGKKSQTEQQLAEAKSRIAALQEKLKGTDEGTLKEQEKTLKTELVNAEKEEAALKKQPKAQDRVDRFSASIADDLNGEESHLKQLNEEDQAILEDENADACNKEAAQERSEARNEELARLQARIEEKEVALPLQKRIKEIFKKMASL